MFSIIGNMFKNNTLVIIIIGVILALLVSVYSVVKISDVINRDANDNNLAAAISAKKDLINSVESNNKLVKQLEEFKRTSERNEQLSKDIEKIEAESRIKQEQIIDIISGIDNTKIKYVEEPVDIEKSRLIINTIWETYDEQANTQESK